MPLALKHRDLFRDGLVLLARAATALREGGHPEPVVVGGAAMEFYTVGHFASGDFDLWTTGEIALERELLNLGFRREDRPGWSRRGFYHPTFLMGVEIVSGDLFDGRSDKARVTIVDIGEGQIRFVPVEDLIADRLGQYAANPLGSPDMLEQAVYLFQVAADVDQPYLDSRIKSETSGDLDLDFLKAQSDGEANDT